jgi:hypothetical protein
VYFCFASVSANCGLVVIWNRIKHETLYYYTIGWNLAVWRCGVAKILPAY